jgi:hypothetical protein
MSPQNKLCTATLVGDNYSGARDLAQRAVQQSFKFQFFQKFQQPAQYCAGARGVP